MVLSRARARLPPEATAQEAKIRLIGQCRQGASSVADLLFCRISAASPSMSPHCGGRLPETLQGAPLLID